MIDLSTFAIRNRFTSSKQSDIVNRVGELFDSFFFLKLQQFALCKEESVFGNTGNFCFWNLEREESYLVESEILSFGIRHTAQGTRNPTKNWNPESKSTDKESRIQYLESVIHGVESTIHECLGC